MPTTIVLASGNRKKLQELQAILQGRSVTLVPQTDFNLPEAVEDGASFVENAIIKARHAALLTGLPAIADDSGIEVDTLGGAPGIYSARYAERAGAGSGDTANNALLLREMAGVPEDKRGARFQCVIAFMRFAGDPMPLICQGTWEGAILHEESGGHGFGYDPLFYVPTHNCSSAQLDPLEKNRISHRAQALRELLKRWPYNRH